MNYKASSVSLRYDATQDRIEWTSHCAEQTFVRTWLTRRFLTATLPRLAQWLDAKVESPAITAAVSSQTPSERQHIRRFEHEVAQHQVKAVREVAPERAFVAEFLLDGLQLQRRKGGFLLALVDREKTYRVDLAMTAPQLHKIVGELVTLSDAGRWNLSNPWQGVGSATVPVTQPVH